jgi:hypothetical protein
MARIGDLSLTSELQRLRESIPPGSRAMLEPTQAFLLAKIKGRKQAADLLVAHALAVLKAVPEGEISRDHPAVGALAIALKQPDADQNVLPRLPATHRAPVEEALRTWGDAEWSPSKLEWQWILVAGAFADTPLRPELSLARQSFQPAELANAWNALLDLEVLRAWGLVT